MMSADDLIYMQRAIQLAGMAADQKEVPVGAVLVVDHCIIGEGYNHPISANDPTAHAEIMALRRGAETIKNYRLVNSTLYVTLQPCAMCMGAIRHARVKRVVFGAADSKSEACQFNHSVDYEGGLLAEDCGQLLKQFFRERR